MKRGKEIIQQKRSTWKYKKKY